MQASAVHSVMPDPVMPEVKETVKATKPRKAKDDGAALQAAAHPVNDAAPISEDADLNPEALTTVEVEVAEPPVAEQKPVVEEQAVVLDFDKDVAPVVLNAVKVKGKPWVQEILSQFGVERASQVPDEQMSELLAAINEGVDA
jgi:hypothetical protein